MFAEPLPRRYREPGKMNGKILSSACTLVFAYTSSFRFIWMFQSWKWIIKYFIVMFLFLVRRVSFYLFLKNSSKFTYEWTFAQFEWNGLTNLSNFVLLKIQVKKKKNTRTWKMNFTQREKLSVMGERNYSFFNQKVAVFRLTTFLPQL